MPPPFKVREFVPCDEEGCAAPARWLAITDGRWCQVHASGHFTRQMTDRAPWRSAFPARGVAPMPE